MSNNGDSSLTSHLSLMNQRRSSKTRSLLLSGAALVLVACAALLLASRNKQLPPSYLSGSSGSQLLSSVSSDVAAYDSASSRFTELPAEYAAIKHVSVASHALSVRFAALPAKVSVPISFPAVSEAVFVRFSTLDPTTADSPAGKVSIIDKALAAAKLPTITQIKRVMKCVVPIAKGLKTLLSKPSASSVASAFSTMDTCEPAQQHFSIVLFGYNSNRDVPLIFYNIIFTTFNSRTAASATYLIYPASARPAPPSWSFPSCRVSAALSRLCAVNLPPLCKSQPYSLSFASSNDTHQLNRAHRYDFFKAQIQRGKEIRAIAAAAPSSAPAEKSKGLGGKIKDAIR